jgi:guanyl-specific ribonuclease Sa
MPLSLLQFAHRRVKSALVRNCNIDFLEPRMMLAFTNWSSIQPAIALVPVSAGQLASAAVVNFGTTVYSGPLSVVNTLNRIRADNGPDRSNDGAVYTNPQASGLPVDGTYYEFTVEVSGGTDHTFSGVATPGPMRILLATGGDCFFTGDHYSTFQPVSIYGGSNSSSPTIGSFAASPASVSVGSPTTLTAGNVTETNVTISSVMFYL